MKMLGPWLTQAHTIHRVVQVSARHIVLLTVVLGLVFSALLAIPFVLYYRAESSNHLSLLQAEQDRIIRLAEGTIHQEIDAALSDLRYLSQHNEIRRYLAQANPGNRFDLAQEYLVLSRQKHLYDQIRFIGLDGREEVRVNYNDGQPEVVATANLQDKADLDYFRKAQLLSPEQIYVSPLDLNVEQGAIDQPLKPVIRFALPVADDRGLVRGMVVLNYLGQRLRDKLGVLQGRAGKIWLLNAEGHWLMGPTQEDEWGFALQAWSQRSLARQFPLLWRQMAAEKSGIHQTASAWIRFERIYPLLGGIAPAGDGNYARPAGAGNYYMTVAVELPQSTLQAANLALLKKLWAGYAALALFAFLVAGALAFAFNRGRSLAEVVERVVDDLPLLVSYVDTEQRYRFNNMAYARFFGVNLKEMYGKTMRELLGEEVYRTVRPYIEQALSGKPVSFERQLTYAGAGRHEVMVSYLPDTMPNGKVRGVYVMVNDISQLKEAERRERRHMIELAHVSRLASMGEMATQIAHEINQPLAAIAMYGSAALRTIQGEFDRGKLETWLEAINTQAKRASDIVRRVRHFVQKGEPQFGPVDLNMIVREVNALIDHEFRSHEVGVLLELAEDLPQVQGDRVLLEQVVFNLVRNAMDALLDQSGERRMTLRTTFDAHLVYFEVSDSGPGIDPALREHIFDSFVTSREEGLGMGLTISRSIIEAHAGILRYTMNPGGGATFMFSLPREV